MKIIYQKVRIYTGKKPRCFEENCCEKKTYPVVAENDKYIVIDDGVYTRLQKEKEKYCNTYDLLGYASIRVFNNDSIFSDSIRLDLYTTVAMSPTKIKNAIKKAVEKKMGWLSSDIDLSIIK